MLGIFHERFHLDAKGERISYVVSTLKKLLQLTSRLGASLDGSI
jgi:hypothetical protein